MKGASNGPPTTQKKLPSKSPALLGLKEKLAQINRNLGNMREFMSFPIMPQ